MFGAQGQIEFLKSVFKLGAVSFLGFMLLRSARHDVTNAMIMEPSALPALILALGTKLLSTVAVAAIVLVAADIVWSRLFWHGELKMTRQEVKDELKQVDGDPIVKARLRSLARDRLRKRMIAAVPRATLVIANPTHYAVALRYVREEGGAPLVVAKGQDLIALAHPRGRHGARHSRDREQDPGAVALQKRRGRQDDPGRVLQGGCRDRVLPPGASGSDKADRLDRARMQRQGNIYTIEREKALADGLRDVASELRLIDAADLIAFIRTEQFANISNLVNSSTELYYKPGTLSFGRSGDIDVKWGATPTISLDMEFHHMQVSVYFRLLLEALQAGIEINYISFEAGSTDPDQNTQRLIAAIANARLSPASHAPDPSSRPGWADALRRGLSGDRPAIAASHSQQPFGLLRRSIRALWKSAST